MSRPPIRWVLVLMLPCLAAQAQVDETVYAVPEVGAWFQHQRAHFDTYEVVLTPDQDEAEWWAGAPSVVIDGDGIFWMAARMRSPDQPRGRRGYEIRLLRSTDGIDFEEVHRIHRTDVPIPGFERPALLIDPATGRFKLYLCGPWQDGPWSILKLDDVDHPAAFDPSTARAVIQPRGRLHERDVTVTEYKDPVIMFAQGRYHAYVTGYVRRNERVFHFVSDDGEAWTPVGPLNQPILDLTGWHNFFVRPASVVPVGVGYLFFYEGSSTQWYDPVYNVVTGVGFTFDLHHVVDLTPDAPLAVSSTPGLFHTWRYAAWLLVGDELWAYAEVAKANQAHEVRLYRLPLE